MIKIHSSVAFLFEHVSPTRKWLLIAEAHSEPSKTSKMELSVKKVDGFCKNS